MRRTALEKLQKQLDGELHADALSKLIYATDASAYRQIPQAVAFPKSGKDIEKLIAFARENKTSLIPRTAGTSLAGQVVGEGIVVDVSKYMHRIIEVDAKEHWVRVQPGVIRDELNLHLKSFNQYFGPETSTANRAMIGGMVGNNSCGSNSVVFGSTRDHLISVKGYLSDGSEVEFTDLSREEFEEKCKGTKTGPLEQSIYCQIFEALSKPGVRERIEDEFPKNTIPRRNTGYAVDLLMKNDVFQKNGEPFNFCKIIAGSEGTLLFITEIKLRTVSLPPKHKILVCAHFNSIHESLEANLVGLKYEPSASELMDHYVLECTKQNIDQQKNRFFVLGDPKAILVVEYGDDDPEKAQKKAQSFISELQQKGMGYHYPIVEGEDIGKVWTLRKAGLGLLSNIPGDAKPVPVIEDTAVDVQDLPAYIDEFNEILKKYDLYCVHYAHAGSGELHLRPIINLKTADGQKLFRIILEEIAGLVKKYRGSLSGEHGDGRLRGEFIRQMIGEENYTLLRDIKYTWDPGNIFNPGKIVDTPPMDTYLRYEKDQSVPEINTFFDFSDEQGVLRSAELCNGSGDCRKTHLSGGTMCPSYMATKDEKDTTRARANTLREFLTHSEKGNRFDHREIKEAMDLCLSCKGCKSECPSNVDMAKLKAEFMQHYHDANGAPLRDKLFSSFAESNQIAARLPFAYNLLTQSGVFSGIFKAIAGIAPQRSLPRLQKQTLRSWFDKNRASINPLKPIKRVYFYADEFTNFNDTTIGIKAIKLLIRLGYEVIIPGHTESGRSAISKGFLRKARQIARKNVEALSGLVTAENPLLGTEPSAILSFRDEYPDLVGDDLKQQASLLAGNCLLIEEFLEKEIKAGHIKRESFKDSPRKIKLHGHCHQKALASLTPTRKILEFPENHEVVLIPSGCCGMAGSFGYEKEHYDTSMKIGELVLFPAVRESDNETIIAAPGTSCRHQIKDGTGRLAQHPVEILYDALKEQP